MSQSYRKRRTRRSENRFLTIFLGLIFSILSLIHFCWSFGGNKGRDTAVPNRMDGSTLFNPGFLSTILVAIGLFSFALFVLIKINLLNFHLPDWMLKYGMITIAVLFILRAIGDFNRDYALEISKRNPMIENK